MPAPSRLIIAFALALAGVLGMVWTSVQLGPEQLVAGDAHYLFATARSLAFDGDLDLTNQYRVMGDRWGLGRDPATDHWRFPPREIGPSLLMVPGLLLHHALGLSARLEPTFACLLAATSLGWTWLGCVLAIEGCSPATKPPAVPHRAELVAGVVVLAFVLPYYATGRSGYAHAPDAAVCAWVAWAILSRRHSALVGVLLACAVLIRLQNGLWLVWPVSVALAAKDPRRALAVGAIACLGLAPQAALALAHPGTEHGALGWSLAFFDVEDLGHDLLRVLFGPHGLVSWTPVTGLALLGTALALGDPQRRRAAIPVAALMVGWWLLFACVPDVDGGDAFGARRFAGATVCLSLGLNELWLRIQGLHSPPARALQVTLLAAVFVATPINLVRTKRAIEGRLSLVSPDAVRGSGSRRSGG